MFMKMVVMVICLVLVTPVVRAQSLSAMLAQLAELEAYAKLAAKGYQIAEKGWHTIQDIKNGEFNLHSVFFTSLKTVNPKVRGMEQAAEVVALELAITSQVKQALARYRDAKGLLPGDFDYIHSFLDAVLTDVQKNGAALGEIITDGEVQMTDGERIRAIQRLNEAAKRDYAGLHTMTTTADALAAARQKEGADLQAMQKMIGLP